MAILDIADENRPGKDRRALMGPRVSGGLWRFVRLTALGAVVGLSLLALGFMAFFALLDRRESAIPHKADAIVVLTGGAERIADAIDLLKNGFGSRLLISGVAQDVTAARLAQKEPAMRGYVSCCIDLGHAALNTAGNAKETRHWAVRNGYKSLIIVTSSYHMPRALVELRRQMPGVELVPATVVTEKLRNMDILRSPGLLKIVGMEYVKFLYAWVRAGLTPGRPMDEINAATTRRRA